MCLALQQHVSPTETCKLYWKFDYWYEFQSLRSFVISCFPRSLWRNIVFFFVLKLMIMISVCNFAWTLLKNCGRIKWNVWNRQKKTKILKWPITKISQENWFSQIFERPKQDSCTNSVHAHLHATKKKSCTSVRMQKNIYNLKCGYAEYNRI